MDSFDMGKFTLILGGARSGKSRYAQDLAKGISKKVAFIATCIPQDREMKKRITLHRRVRPHYWKTIEEPKDLKPVLINLKSKFDVIIVDCIGLLISNFLSAGLKEKEVKEEINSIANILSKSESASIVVSNEVGCGLVPENQLARHFRDLIGLANQAMANKADQVIFMQSGIPMKIK